MCQHCFFAGFSCISSLTNTCQHVYSKEISLDHVSVTTPIVSVVF